MREARRHARLGQLLTESGAITTAALDHALREQRESGGRLGEVLVSLGLTAQEQVASALARQLGLEFAPLADMILSKETLLLVQEPLARRHQVVPVRLDDGVMVLGMVDPLDVVALDDVRRATGLLVKPAVITPEDFYHALSQYPGDAVDRILGEIHAEAPVLAEDSLESLQAISAQVPVVRLVDQMIRQAVRQGASDIHVEPQEFQTRIRYRIDGLLYVTMTPPRHIHAALVSRLKIMARLNIAERRLPQDGRIEMRVDDRDIDFRVATVPTVWGEKVVLRILDKSGAFVGVEKIGLLPEDFPRFDGLISKPYGIILLTGPTGSGKTTTLYAILNRLNRSDVNITTIEDPVEYHLPGIAQVQINPKAGVTFATGLRSFLRQDPDIIMVGEIRDEETARIATHAALTGHLVLSTLHTNDAPGAVTRLVDMGIEPFLVASSVIGVIAQRLVRVLCRRCREPYQPTPETLRGLGLDGAAGGDLTFYRAVGCEFCNRTGYKGRTGIFEIMVLEDVVKDLVVRHSASGKIKEAAVAAGMRTLRQAGLAKVVDGTTSLEEVLRVAFVEEA